MDPVILVSLHPLMERGSGNPEVAIGLIDGPVITDHKDLNAQNVRQIPGGAGAGCSRTESAACVHGTFVAGILSGKRGSTAPAICPSCTLLVRPIFGEAREASQGMPSATPEELAKAIIECIRAGARVLNVSAALSELSSGGEQELEEALTHAAKSGVIVVAACGNQGTIGSSAITRHPWVIPVVACDDRGRPMEISNLGSSVGERGLCAPGKNVTSLGALGDAMTFSGTSVATAFVTGAVALVWSEFLRASPAEVKFAVTQAYAQRRRTIVPPLLNAWASYGFLANHHLRTASNENH